MAWFGRQADPRPTGPQTQEDTPGSAVARAAPGLIELFEGLGPGGSHSVLDLGEGSSGNLRFYGHFARRIRFADLLGPLSAEAGWNAALDALPHDPEHPYDVVLAWNALDRMEREQRPRVIDRLVEITAPGARLYVLTDLSESPTTRPLRFALLDSGRVAQQPVGPEEAAYPPLLPAELERMLKPFEIEHSFVLRNGMREYVAMRPVPTAW